MKILLVEDDLITIKLLESILAKEGFDTLAAGTVREAIDHLESGAQIGLIISDIMLPGGDGFDFLKYLNAKRRFKKIPVLMCTSLSDKASVMRGTSLGAKGYIIKPIKKRTLLPKVKELLGNKVTSVLVVDDEQLVVNILRNTLERYGYNVLSTNSGQDALEMLSSRQIHAVISDTTMPNMSGYDLLLNIKEKYKSIPVFLIIGYSGKHEKEQALAAGADGFITKPFNNMQIVQTVKNKLKPAQVS